MLYALNTVIALWRVYSSCLLLPITTETISVVFLQVLSTIRILVSHTEISVVLVADQFVVRCLLKLISRDLLIGGCIGFLTRASLNDATI